MTDTFEQTIHTTLQELEPYVHSHGGTIEFVSYTHPFVHVRLKGSCETCPISVITLKLGIQKKLREHVEDIEVVAVEEELE